jgi:hypothetical protein
MPLHPKRQRLQSLQEQECVERRKRRAEIAEGLSPELHQVAVGSERLVELQAVIGRRRIRDHRKTSVRPVELAGFDDHAADAGPVAADELGRRMNDDIGTPFDRAAQVRRRERVVHDQWQPVLVGDRRHRLDVQHIPAGVADRLAE